MLVINLAKRSADRFSLLPVAINALITNSPSLTQYFNSLTKIYKDYGCTILLRKITKDLKNETQKEEIKKIIKRINPELTDEKINNFINTGYSAQMVALEIKKYAEKEDKKGKQKV